MKLKNEITKELTNHIIPFWKNLRDDEHGGFYGQLDFELNLNKKAEKGCILNSRILWFFSKAHLLLKDESLLDYANHAYNFMMKNCIDNDFGGVFWSVNYDGTVADDTKHTYNQAFAIYALSAYYSASGNKNAIDTAFELMNSIENKCTDSGGYLEAFSREWEKSSNEKLSENGVMAERTMNTLLHVFEGYCGLYEATQDKKTRVHIKRILRIISEKVYNHEKHRQEVFFDLSYNSLIDLHSYGHDIETAWLVDWGCGLLDDKAFCKEIGIITDSLCENVYNLAFAKSSLYNECENGIVDKKRVWWVQCEAVIGFINHYQKHPEDVKYLNAAEEIWNVIKNHIIDNRQGSEWFSDIDDNFVPSSKKDIVEPWKCPYHNGRLCFEIIRRL